MGKVGRHFRALVGTALLLVVSPLATPDSLGRRIEAAPEFRPCYIDGIPDQARCTRVDVPLDYQRPDGARISLHVALIPATGTVSEPDPLVVFTGGPGQAASDYGRFAGKAFGKVREARQLLLIDQRGTGRSQALNCPLGIEWLAPEALTRRAAECRAGASAPVEFFTLESVIRDTESIRARLAIEKLNLWGGSYGTRTAALYLRRYPERVRSIVLDGVLPPDVPLFASAPKTTQSALERLLEDCAANPSCGAAFPDLGAQANALFQRVASADTWLPGIDPATSQIEPIRVDRDVVVNIIRTTLYTSDRSALLPLVISRSEQGDFRPLAALAQDGNQITKTMAIGATLSILCGEELPRLTPEEARAAGQGTFIEDSYYRFWRHLCAGWTAVPPGPGSLGPLTSDVPALLLSGELDPVTPPELGERLLQGLPKGRHLVVPATGHNTSHVACMPDLIASFIDRADASHLDAGCLSRLKRPAFVTAAAGPITVSGVNP